MKFYIEIILQWFKNLNRKQQYILGLSSVIFIFLTAFLSFFALQPEFAVLFNQLDPKDTQQIIKQLDEGHIEYQILNEGREIRIPQHLIEKTRLHLLSKGMQFSGTIGFELFDKSDFGMTDFSQKINFQRALQGELERTINSLEEVQQSRVHLVIPEHRLFQENNNAPKAAVTLHLRSPLNKIQIASIQQLIHASVPNLQIQQVVLIDSQGNSLTPQEDNSETVWFGLKKSMENYLVEKVTQQLQTLFKSDEILVKVDLTLNHDQREMELIKPDTQGIVTHEKEIQRTSTSNLEKSSNSKDITREKSYQSGTRKEHVIHASGGIQHLGISVLLPEKTKPEQINRIRELVKSAVGFDAERGDSISVEALIPEKIPTNLPKPVSLPIQQNLHPQLLPKIFVLTFLFAATGMYYRHQRIRKKRKMLLQELTQWLESHE